MGKGLLSDDDRDRLGAGIVDSGATATSSGITPMDVRRPIYAQSAWVATDPTNLQPTNGASDDNDGTTINRPVESWKGIAKRLALHMRDGADADIMLGAGGGNGSDSTPWDAPTSRRDYRAWSIVMGGLRGLKNAWTCRGPAAMLAVDQARAITSLSDDSTKSRTAIGVSSPGWTAHQLATSCYFARLTRSTFTTPTRRIFAEWPIGENSATTLYLYTINQAANLSTSTDMVQVLRPAVSIIPFTGEKLLAIRDLGAGWYKGFFYGVPADTPIDDINVRHQWSFIEFGSPSYGSVLFDQCHALTFDRCTFPNSIYLMDCTWRMFNCAVAQAFRAYGCHSMEYAGEPDNPMDLERVSWMAQLASSNQVDPSNDPYYSTIGIDWQGIDCQAWFGRPGRPSSLIAHSGFCCLYNGGSDQAAVEIDGTYWDRESSRTYIGTVDSGSAYGTLRSLLFRHGVTARIRDGLDGTRSNCQGLRTHDGKIWIADPDGAHANAAGATKDISIGAVLPAAVALGTGSGAFSDPSTLNKYLLGVPGGRGNVCVYERRAASGADYSPGP